MDISCWLDIVVKLKKKIHSHQKDGAKGCMELKGKTLMCFGDDHYTLCVLQIRSELLRCGH